MSVRRLVPMALAFLCAAALTAVRTVSQLNVPGSPRIARYGMQDFRDAVYYPVVALLEGTNPYDVHDYLARYPVGAKFPLYSPVTLAVHLPLGLLSQVHAEYAFLAVSLLLMLAVAAVSLRIAGAEATAPAVLGLGTLLVLSHPGHMSLFIGQSTAVVVLGLYLALYYASTRPALAALGLALACLKPTFGAPAALLLFVRGDRRAVLGGLTLAAGVSAVVAAFLARAAGGVGPFVHSLWNNYALWDHTFVSSARSVFRIDILGSVGRLLGRNLTAAEDLALTWSLLGLAALAVRRLARSEDGEAHALSTSLVCVALLVAVYHQVYDALVLTVPALIMTLGPGGRARRIAAVLLVVPAVNYLATDAAVGALGLAGPVWTLVATINGAAVLGAFLVLLSMSLRPVVVSLAAVEPARLRSVSGR